MTSLSTFLKGIADAIRTKKGTTDTINASNFATEISNIQTGSTKAQMLIDLLEDTNVSKEYFFYCRPAFAKEIENVNSLSLTYNISYMFYNSSANNTLTKLPTLTITAAQNYYYTLAYAFYNNTGLTNLTLNLNCRGNPNNETVNAFTKCTSLKTITLNNPLYNSTNPYIYLYNANNTFFGCESLESISGDPLWINGEYISNFFYKCKKLEKVYFYKIGNGITTKSTTFQLASGTTWGHLLRVECLLSAIQACYVRTTYTPILVIGSANLEKLANIYVKITLDDNYTKPFDLCESTDEGAMTISDYLALKGWTLA